MEQQAQEALKAALEASKCSVESDILEYLAGSCSAVLEEAADRSSAEQELKEAIEAQLEDAGADAATITSVCKAVAAVKFGTVSAPSKKSAAKAASREEDGLLCRVQDLILMYGGSSKALLSHTSFEMRKGHRYGIVGHNGAGKTTLMAALLSGAVKEMPSDLNLVHVHGGSVMETGDPEMPALDFALQRRQELGLESESQDPATHASGALEAVGFGQEMQHKALGQLSGGWRMRLALACAMMKRCDVLLLDEPTNHLDTGAVEWLGNYLKGLSGTSLIISHEPEFLNEVCTDIIHFDEQKLKYYSGNFASFLTQTSLDDEEAQAVLETKGSSSLAVAGKAIQGHQDGVRLNFPIPGKLDGITSTTKPILEVKKVSFQYSEGAPFILKEVSAKLSLSSRVAVVGANGAGKSTLLSVLCGESAPIEFEGSMGEVVRHRNLRLSYIAQHHTFHLEEFLKCTPVHYFQLRFRNGYDEQLQKRLMDPGTEEDQKLRAQMAEKLGKYGNTVREIVGRQKRGKEIVYEVAWEGLEDPKQNTFEPLSKLKQMKVDGLARAFDERLAAQAAGVSERPLTDREIVKHLESFQMTEEMSTKRMISGFSAGQKSRLMLGAAFWTKPHVIALDEPTNYLDPETVGALAKALKNFRGGVIAVTHSQHFIDEVCTEAWNVKDGAVTVSKLENAASATPASAPSVSKPTKADASSAPAAPAPPRTAAAAAAAAAAARKG